MQAGWESVHITHCAKAVAGSPFKVRLRYRRLHVDPQIAPLAAKRPVQEFLIFELITANVSVGDMVAFTDASVAKIIDVRSYPNSLQCMLQRIPYQTASLWIPKPASSQIDADKSLSDAVYIVAPSVSVLLEPHGEQTPEVLPIGRADRRRCWAFSTQPLNQQSILGIGGDHWLLLESSSFWPISSDYRASAIRLIALPVGVT